MLQLQAQIQQLNEEHARYRAARDQDSEAQQSTIAGLFAQLSTAEQLVKDAQSSGEFSAERIAELEQRLSSA